MCENNKFYNFIFLPAVGTVAYIDSRSYRLIANHRRHVEAGEKLLNIKLWSIRTSLTSPWRTLSPHIKRQIQCNVSAVGERFESVVVVVIIVIGRAYRQSRFHWNFILLFTSNTPHGRQPTTTMDQRQKKRENKLDSGTFAACIGAPCVQAIDIACLMKLLN